MNTITIENYILNTRGKRDLADRIMAAAGLLPDDVESITEIEPGRWRCSVIERDGDRIRIEEGEVVRRQVDVDFEPGPSAWVPIE